MNPKFCRTCRKPKPREGFRILQGVTPPREVCSDCYIHIMQARKKMREAKPRAVPF